ncbi:MAG: prepilin-type N-terminal cleavage/methylation domain-containing protein [Vibrio sp.]
MSIQPSRTVVREGFLRSQGFTLIELIVVIVLISIVSVYAASRYAGKDNFSALTMQEQVIAVIRQVQLQRMQSNLASLDDNADYVLSLQAHCIGSVVACERASQVGGDNGQSNAVFTQSVTFMALPNLTQIHFNLLGSPIDAAQQGVTITITAAQSSAQVCINSQGYVHRGGCN